MMKRRLHAGFLCVCCASMIPALVSCRSVNAPETSGREWTPPDSSKVALVQDVVGASVQDQSKDVSQPLGLPDLVALALKSNPDLMESWENARIQQAKLEQADSRYYPSVTLSGSAALSRTDSGQGENEDLDDTSYGPKATLSWLLLDVGGRSGSSEAARQTLIAYNFNYNRAIQDLLLNVAGAYYNYYSAIAGVEAAETNLVNVRENLNAAQQKLDAGLSTRLDVLQAQSDYDNALFSLEDARGKVQTARGNVCKTVGLAADASFDIVLPTNVPPLEIAETDVGAMIRASLDRRPDIAALRAGVKAGEAALKSAASDLWPSLSLNASGQSTQHDYSGTPTADQLQDSEYTYTAYLGLEWAIFDGFYRAGVRREKRAALGQLRAQLKSAEIALSADVWTKYYEFQTAAKKYTYSQSYLSSSQASYDLALEGYQAGLKNILDLLQAQSKLSDARSQAVSARTGVLIALANLAHALGTLNTQDSISEQNAVSP